MIINGLASMRLFPLHFVLRCHCKRFEHKIQQLKRLVSSSNSVINLAKQMASKYSQNYKDINLRNVVDEADNFIENSKFLK